MSIGPPSLLSSVWGYISSQGMTGDQADILRAHNLPDHVYPTTDHRCPPVGGPDRPIPKPKPQPQRQGSLLSRSSASSSRPMSPGSSSTSAQAIANNASSGVNDLYSRLNNALQERGCVLSSASTTLSHFVFRSEMLNGLEDSFRSLETGSKGMLAQVCHFRFTQNLNIRLYRI